MICKGDLVRHTRLGYVVKKKKNKVPRVNLPGAPVCPLLGMVLGVYPNQGNPSRELVKVLWLGGVKVIRSHKIIPTDNLVLHKNLIKEVPMNP
jgi:hypothetical protein